MSKSTPHCRGCGAESGTEFPLWPKSGVPFGTVCVKCDEALQKHVRKAERIRR
jgi:hypothetical protein